MIKTILSQSDNFFVTRHVEGTHGGSKTSQLAAATRHCLSFATVQMVGRSLSTFFLCEQKLFFKFSSGIEKFFCLCLVIIFCNYRNNTGHIPLPAIPPNIVAARTGNFFVTKVTVDRGKNTRRLC